MLFASLHSEAQSSQTPQEAFCQRVEKQELNQWLYKNENRLAFSNSGGRLGIGLCWWHARFQRRLNHLLVFTGNENTPTSCPLWNHHQIDELFSRVLDYKMTEIPCYKNLFDFSGA